MPKDGLISSYFSQAKPTPEARRNEETTEPVAAKVLGSRSRRESAGSSGEEEQGVAKKQPRLQLAGPSSTARTKEGRLDQWKFDRGAAEVVKGANGAAVSEQIRTEEQEARHAAFTRRLLTSIERDTKRKEDKKREEVTPNVLEIDDDDEGEGSPSEGTASGFLEFAAPKQKGQSRPSKDVPASDGTKYTPLEKQYLDLRKANPDVLLCIEVGYKFKFYGDDARVASRELNIACFMEKHLMTAMVPLHRLQLHIKKLVLAGHKVGVVRQTETRALKAASANASKPFSREMTELYTASTWVDDMLDSGQDGSNPASPRSLLAIVEKSEGGSSGAEERVSIGLIAIQMSTGTITYDQFHDTTMRSELETRLAHLEPAEIILPSDTSKQTYRLVSYIAGQSSHASAALRIETTRNVPSYNAAYASVGEFYAKGGFAQGSENDAAAAAVDKKDAEMILSVVVGLPSLALVALAVAIEHLSKFHLESVFRLATNFSSFASRNEMLLTGNTLSNLEILENNTDYREKGSLMWLLGSGCNTTMGRRMLRRWLTRPLTSFGKLQERSNAVEGLLQNRVISAKVSALLKGLPDLEKGLARLLYQRAAPTELATILLALNRVTTEFELGEHTETFGSPLLDEAIAMLPKARTIVQDALSAVSIPMARENNKRDLFVDVDRYEYVQDTKDLISVADCDLHEHLMELRKMLKNPRLQYATIALEEYLIEVAKDTRLTIPPDWSRINSTKKVTRYRSPQIIRIMKERAQLQETLDAQADKAFRSFVQEMCDEHYSLLRDVVRSLATLDALVSLSVLAGLPGYSKATFVEGIECIELRSFRHPMTEALLETTYVDNDISLGDTSHDKAKGVLLTGSNMGGKSSTVRAIALVVIMAQVGSYVPAAYARLSLHDAVLTRMGASDQLAKGRSTFMVEVQETAEIMRAATSKSLVLLDELGRGTSTHDGQAIAEAVLQHLLEREVHRRPMLFFVTHFLSLGRMMATLPLRGMHMTYFDRGDNDIAFLYKIKDGLAEKSFGIHCARLAALPSSLLDLASQKAAELEEKTTERLQQRREARHLRAARLLFSGKEEQLRTAQMEEIRLVLSMLGIPL